MCRRAGLHSDQTSWHPSKERKDLAAAQALTQRHVAHCVDRMNLEDVLCKIKTDCCNVAHGWLPLLVICDDHHLGTSMPSGGHPPHQFEFSIFQQKELHHGEEG